MGHRVDCSDHTENSRSNFDPSETELRYLTLVKWDWFRLDNARDNILIVLLILTSDTETQHDSGQWPTNKH